MELLYREENNLFKTFLSIEYLKEKYVAKRLFLLINTYSY